MEATKLDGASDVIQEDTARPDIPVGDANSMDVAQGLRTGAGRGKGGRLLAPHGWFGPGYALSYLGNLAEDIDLLRHGESDGLVAVLAKAARHVFYERVPENIRLLIFCDDSEELLHTRVARSVHR